MFLDHHHHYKWENLIVAIHVSGQRDNWIGINTPERDRLWPTLGQNASATLSNSGDTLSQWPNHRTCCYLYTIVGCWFIANWEFFKIQFYDQFEAKLTFIFAKLGKIV